VGLNQTHEQFARTKRQSGPRDAGRPAAAMPGGAGAAALPPLPPGTRGQADAAHKRELAWDPAADLPESEDEDALSGAPTAPSSQPGTAPASRQQKRRQKREISTVVEFHASLSAALRVDEERKAQALADIYKTSGLQSSASKPRVAEDIYRSLRVVHNSQIVRAPPLPRAEGKLIRDANNNYCKGSMPSRCVCPYERCPFMDDEAHMEKFLHWCPQENMCDQRGDQEHLHNWLHSSDLAGQAEDALTGWKLENKISPFCVPHRAVSMYQNHEPRVAYCPRGGNRPLKGNKGISTEFYELAKTEDQIPTDFVTLLLKGIEPTWDDEKLLSWCRMHAPPHAIIHVAKVTTRRGNAQGTGYVSFLNYEDAQQFVNVAHGQGLSSSKLQVSYARQEHVDPGITKKDNSYVQAEKKRFAESMTVARMNRLIKSCGMAFPACPAASSCGICSQTGVLLFPFERLFNAWFCRSFYSLFGSFCCKPARTTAH